MARVTVEREWLVRGAGDIEGAVVRAVGAVGMKATPGADGLELRGGSQLKVRLAGSLLTRDDYLPRDGLLYRSAVPADPSFERVTLRLEETLGIGLMGPVMRHKYERVLGSAAAAIDKAVRESAVEVRDALPAVAAPTALPAATAPSPVPAAPTAAPTDEGWATVVPADHGPAQPPAAAAPAPAVPAAQQAAPGPAEELEHLASLHERGILTDEEFNAAKAKLLAS